MKAIAAGVYQTVASQTVTVSYATANGTAHAGVAVVALAALLPGGARAHPQLVGTTPSANTTVDTAPPKVIVRLSEPADPVGDGISVTGPSGREVARGPVGVSGSTLSRAIDAREQGSYLV